MKKIIDHIILIYFESLSYKALSDVTKRDYKLCINKALTTKIDGKFICTFPISTFDTPKAQLSYNIWAERGVPFANHIQAVMSKVFNHARQIGMAKHNPFTLIVKLKHRARKEVQTKKSIYKFIETAYSEFKWRNVGVIVHMAYTWGQRLGDMRTLKFKDYDLSNRVLTLEQSKRRAKVYLPTTDELHKILINQRDDMGFQDYVAPRISYGKILSEPYSKAGLNNIARLIRKAAELPNTFWIMDMRRTATTEMVDAGVPLPQIMSVTGHANAQSLAPYMKNTLTSATEALNKRRQV